MSWFTKVRDTVTAPVRAAASAAAAPIRVVDEVVFKRASVSSTLATEGVRLASAGAVLTNPTLAGAKLLKENDAVRGVASSLTVGISDRAISVSEFTSRASTGGSFTTSEAIAAGRDYGIVAATVAASGYAASSVLAAPAGTGLQATSAGLSAAALATKVASGNVNLSDIGAAANLGGLELPEFPQLPDLGGLPSLNGGGGEFDRATTIGPGLVDPTSSSAAIGGTSLLVVGAVAIAVVMLARRKGR